MVKKKKDINVLYIIIGIVIFFLFSTNGRGLFSSKEDVYEFDLTKSETPVNIELRVKTEPKKTAVIQGELITDAIGQFLISITNDKIIDITDVQFVQQYDDSSACETAATDEFEDPATQLPWTTAGTITPSETYPSTPEETAWFDLECYAATDPRTIRFTFEFSYDYVDAAGTPQNDIQIIANADVDIFPEICSDTTPLGNCNSLGEVCIYEAGTGPDLQMDRSCCEGMGGIWAGTTCNFDCAGIPVGNCRTVPIPNVVTRNTYCSPDTGLLEENCGFCGCYDYYSNPSTGCDGSLCLFDSYGGSVDINLVDTQTLVTYCDTLGDWTPSGNCGEAPCTYSFDRLRTRVNSPPGCTATDGFGDQACLFDPSCYTEPGQDFGYSGFESGEQGWVFGGADGNRQFGSSTSYVLDDGSLGGEWSAHLQDDSTTSYFLKNFDFSAGYSEVIISFWHIMASIETNEYVELYCDSTQIGIWYDGDPAEGTWTHEEITITPADCAFDNSVQIRFTSDPGLSGNSDEWYVDGINVTAPGQVGFVCSGTPSACDTYGSQETCEPAGCTWGVPSNVIFDDDGETWGSGNCPAGHPWDTCTYTGGDGDLARSTLSNRVYSGSYSVQADDFDPPGQQDALTKTLDLSSCSQITLSFWWGGRRLDATDYGTLRINDGTSHDIFSVDNTNGYHNGYPEDADGSGWNLFSQDITSSYDFSSPVTFSWSYFMAGGGEVVIWDEFEITCNVGGGESCSGTPTPCSLYNDEPSCENVGCQWGP